MGRKLLFLFGIGAGYVIGARAGREQYDKMAATVDDLWHSPRVVKARTDVEAYARQQAPIIAERAETAAKKTAAVAKDVADKTASTAKDVADRTTEVARDVADRTTVVAKDVAGRTTVIAKDTVSRVTGGPMPDEDSVVGPLGR